MEMVPITEERMEQLAEYAQRCGQGTGEALDTALAEYLSWERTAFDEAVRRVEEGYLDLRAGRTESSEEMFEALCAKHGFSR